MSPITVIAWLIIALLLLGLAVCSLLVVVFDQRDDLRNAREERDRAVAEARRARADLIAGHAHRKQVEAALAESRRMYEDLADAAAADRQLIEAFIPTHGISEEDLA